MLLHQNLHINRALFQIESLYGIIRRLRCEPFTTDLVALYGPLILHMLSTSLHHRVVSAFKVRIN